MFMLYHAASDFMYMICEFIFDQIAFHGVTSGSPYCAMLLKHAVVYGVIDFAKFYRLLKKSIQCPVIVYIYTVLY